MTDVSKTKKFARSGCSGSPFGRRRHPAIHEPRLGAADFTDRIPADRAGADGSCGRERRRTALGPRAGRRPLRAGGLVGPAAGLAAAWRRQPDRRILHPHRRHRRQRILLLRPRRQRLRRKERMAAGVPLRDPARLLDGARPDRRAGRAGCLLQRHQRRRLDPKQQLVEQQAAQRVAWRGHRPKRSCDCAAPSRFRTERTSARSQRPRQPDIPEPRIQPAARTAARTERPYQPDRPRPRL